LVARLVLESGRYNSASWFPNINRFVAACVPNLGAPIAVARALGLEGSTTISAPDMKTIMNDSRFPTGFELFPAPPYRNQVLYDDGNPDNAEHPHKAWDIYAPRTATHFQLSQPNQAAALKSWSLLDLGKRPKGVRYISIAGIGLPTANKFTFQPANIKYDKVDGDSVVPKWSAAAQGFDEYHEVAGEHIKVMNTTPFKNLIHQIFNSRMAVTSYRLDKPGVSINVQQEFKPDEMMDVLLIPDARTTRISGDLSIKQAASTRDGDSITLTSIGIDLPVTYEGPPTASLSLVIPAPQQPGAYVLTFEGTHGSTEETGGTFFVNRATTLPPVSSPKKGKGSSKPKEPTPKPKKPRKAK
jgi:hypothetical protein